MRWSGFREGRCSGASRVAVGWVLVLVGVLGAACSTGSGRDPGAGGVDPLDGAASLGHVHALGTDPADGVLYAASHYGVFRLEDGSASRVADRWQDTMGFTVIGPQRFIGSGHPDLREKNLPAHLGLISSTDGAESWESVSLSGEADFHALEATEGGDRVVGFDALTGKLLLSTDAGESWRVAAQPGGGLVDLALNPADDTTVLATTPAGELMTYDLSDRSVGGTGAPESRGGGVPPLVFVDWPTEGLLVGLATDGVVYSSSDDGGSWVRAGEVPGQVQALDVTADRWHAATSAGVFESTDHGRSWVNLAQPG